MNKLMKSLGMFAVLVMLLLVTACNNSVESDSKKPTNNSTEKPVITKPEPEPSDQTSAESQLKQVVEDNLQAMNEENLTKYMDTISKNASPEIRSRTEKAIKFLFENFDLESSVKDFKVISVSKDFAVVEVVQETVSKNPNPQYKNNRSVTQHTFVKEDGQWKFQTSVVKSSKEIDSSGNEIGTIQ